MNKRDVFLPSLSALLIFGFIWFLSCSHSMSRRQLSQEELRGEYPHALAEESDLKDEFQFKTEVLQALKESDPSTETTSESTNTKTPSEQIQLPVTEPAPVIAPSKRKVPKVSSKPKVSGKFNLNRFYFVRRGDTPEGFAEKVYENSKFSRALKQWNPGKWTPGKLVYYQSALNPTDSRVQSFYQEAGLSVYEVRIKNGESLSRVAKRELGHFQSWKELAVINGIQEVDQVSAGTVLAVYSLTKRQPVAKAPAPVVQAPAPVVQVPAPVVQAPAPVVQAPAPVVQAPAPVVQAPASRPQQRMPSSPMKESWTQKLMSFFETMWEETTEFIETTAKNFSQKTEGKKR